MKELFSEQILLEIYIQGFVFYYFPLKYSTDFVC